MFVTVCDCVCVFQEVENTEARIAALEASLKSMVYEYVCRSLFKVKCKLKCVNKTNVALTTFDKTPLVTLRLLPGDCDS